MQHVGDLRCLHRHGIPITHLRAGFSWLGGLSPGTALPSREGASPRPWSELRGCMGERVKVYQNRLGKKNPDPSLLQFTEIPIGCGSAHRESVRLSLQPGISVNESL